MTFWKQHRKSSLGSTEPAFIERGMPGSQRVQLYLLLLAAAGDRGWQDLFEVRGRCMWPTIKPGDRLSVRPLQRAPRVGDVLVCHVDSHVVVHRVMQHGQDERGQGWVRCRGDAALELDAPLPLGQVLGRVERIERGGRQVPLRRSAAISSRLVAAMRPVWHWLTAQHPLAARASSVRSLVR